MIRLLNIKLFESLLLVLLLWQVPTRAENEYNINVKDFGAIGNGYTLDTESIQAAIDKASEIGGAKVIVPSGTYKIGTLLLKDNVNLFLQPGAMLLGSPDIKDYIPVLQKLESRTKIIYSKYFMIFAENVKNISITGKGIINGNGFENFQVVRPQNERPFIIRLVNCKNVTVRDIQLLESANWTFHLLGCTSVTIDGIKIENRTKGGNRDGLDIDACKDVTVSNCKISTMDDAIVLKSTNNFVCENVTITNCVLTSDASAIKTGTESNGGFKNISISNCVIKNIPIHAGIELMTVDGGDLENVTINNISMDSVATPIFIYLGNRARPFKKRQYIKKISKVNNIMLSNISVTNAKLPSGVVGINNRTVKNVSFNNVSIKYSSTIDVEPLAANSVPYLDLSYPMAIMHGKNLPAYGFYCRNVDDITFNNVSIYSALGEKRPAMLFDKVNGLELNSIKIKNDKVAATTFYLRNSKNIYTTFCRVENKIKSLFQIEKNNCGNIFFHNNLLHNVEKENELVNALPEKQLFAEIKPAEKFEVTKNNISDGLQFQNITDTPLEVEFEINKKVTPQICLLIKSDIKKQQKVRINYNNISQEFTVDWDKWGWAPITLTQKFSNKTKLKFTIEAVSKSSRLLVSKVYLKNLKLGYTD